MITREDIDRLKEQQDELTEEELETVVTVELGPYRTWQGTLAKALMQKFWGFKE